MMSVMRAFEVHLNGKRLCTAGVGDGGVLTAIVSLVPHTASEAPRLDVGGLISSTNEHVYWKQRTLRLGDEVRISLVERDAVDRPKRRTVQDPTHDLKAQKKYVREMARKFGWKIST